MADPTPTPAPTPEPSPEPTPAPPPEGNPPSPEPGGGSGGSEPSPEALVSQRDEARRDAAAYRERLRAAETERDELKRAQESEAEREKREANEAKQALAARDAELQELRLANTVAMLAPKHQIVDAETALALVRPKISFEDGQPVGVDEALKALVKDKPFLQGTSTEGTGNGATNPARGRELQDAEIEKLPFAQRAHARLTRGYAVRS